MRRRFFAPQPPHHIHHTATTAPQQPHRNIDGSAVDSSRRYHRGATIAPSNKKKRRPIRPPFLYHFHSKDQRINVI
jgi:hypothetical protein